jgi:hypothetical protein
MIAPIEIIDSYDIGKVSAYEEVLNFISWDTYTTEELEYFIKARIQLHSKEIEVEQGSRGIK